MLHRLAARAALGALIALAACGPARPSAHVTRLEPANVEMYARLLQMTDARRLDIPLVRQALRTPANAVRAEAALAIGQVHGSELIGVLRALLADPDTAVAANAAFSIGLLRDSLSVPVLTQTLLGPPAVAAEAAWALGRVGERARHDIESALASATLPPSVTEALLLAAAGLQPVPLRTVIPYLRSTNARIRWCAVYAVARPYAPAGVRAVRALVHDPSAEVRALVARAMSHRAAGDSLRSTALAALDTLVRDSDPHVRIEAIRSLASYGSAAGTPVLAAVHDRDANVRVTAAQNLGAVLDAGRATWMQVWRADTAFMFRKSVLVSAMSRDVVLPAADEDNPDGWRHMGDWRYRAAVAEAGGAGSSVERVREVSLPEARDPDPRVRAAAFAAFAPYVTAKDAAQHAWRRDLMLWALHDFDCFVRATAISSLTRRASAADAPAVLQSYQLALRRDSLSDAKIVAIRYLASAWRHDSAAFGDSLRAAIAALPAPADPMVRAAAGDVSLFAAWGDAHASGRPLDWYEQRVRELVLPALAGTLPRAEIVTERGPIEVELFALDAPLTVYNFLSLAGAGYYDGVRFHRVVPDFVVQAGDRRGDGNGGPAYTIRDELNRRRYGRGVVGMALAGPDTGGSQYFITLSPQPHLDGGYTVFGRVTAGFDVLDALVQGDRIETIRRR